MTLIEGGLAGHGAINGDFGQLRQFLQLFSGVREKNAHAGPDHRLFGVQQQLCRVLNVSDRWRLGSSLGRLVVQGGVGNFHGADVGGNLNNDRAGPSVAQGVEGAAHD